MKHSRYNEYDKLNIILYIDVIAVIFAFVAAVKEVLGTI